MAESLIGKISTYGLKNIHSIDQIVRDCLVLMCGVVEQTKNCWTLFLGRYANWEKMELLNEIISEFMAYRNLSELGKIFVRQDGAPPHSLYNIRQILQGFVLSLVRH